MEADGACQRSRASFTASLGTLALVALAADCETLSAVTQATKPDLHNAHVPSVEQAGMDGLPAEAASLSACFKLLGEADDHFAFEKVIGRGKFGTVFSASMRIGGEAVAIKKLDKKVTRPEACFEEAENQSCVSDHTGE
jgi:hypothetical protein